MYDKQTLIALVREKALEFGDFTLASGRKASYYLDCRKLTLDSAGANQVGEGILDLLGNDLPDAVGGMAIGAFDSLKVKPVAGWLQRLASA